MTETPFDSTDFRKTMGTFCTGITIVTTQGDADVHGMTANSFTSVSLNPPLVLVAVDKRAETHQHLAEARRFGVSVLLDDQLPVSNHFAGKWDDAVARSLEYDYIDGIPVLRECLSHLTCDLWATYDGGDHTLYVGQVTSLQVNEGQPLLYYRSGYRRLAED